MKMNFRRWGIVTAAALMSVGMCMPVMADTKISNVKITLSGEEPIVGEGIDTLDVKIPENAYYKVDESFYTNEGDDEWERGTVPVYSVELRAKDGYYFPSSLGKGSVSISGMHGTYKSSGRLDGGDGFRVDIKLRKVAGELSDIDENYWEGKTAVWEKVDDADEYEVRLYRGTRTVQTVTTSNHRYNLYPYMTARGEYSFKVRAISKSDGEKSAWTELSDDIYISDSSVYTGTAPGTGGNTGTGGVGGPGGAHMGSNGWNQNQYGWWYQLNDGNSVKNSWIFVDNNWFYLDGNGYMMTGLQFIEGRWFYLNSVSDGTKGAMLTGFQNIGGVYYYFNTVSDGTRGAMLTSYQNINGNWYFFDVNTGAMWANRSAPNGKWIDGAGVVH